MPIPRRVHLAYGRDRLPLDLDPALAAWQVIEPHFPPSIPDATAAFAAAAARPDGCPPLREMVRASDRVVIVTADGTRPVPNRRLIPWILDALPCPAENVTVLLGNGTHRPNTPAEIEAMFGPDLVRRVRIVNHVCSDPAANMTVGRLEDGTTVALDRVYVEADRRIAVGFIEPHFVAGFSGGAKAIVPGVAAEAAIHRIHNAALIADPRSTWGELDGNPLRAALEAMVALCPPDFLVNVTLDRDQRITGMYAGHYLKAHRAGCVKVRAEAMTAVDAPFPVVVTSNSGAPLDQNLYQTVKGISAAARITATGGTIIVASACGDGLPAGSRFAEIMTKGTTPQAVLDWINAQPRVVADQWQSQTLAAITLRARVLAFTGMPAADVRSCQIEPVADLQAAVEAEIKRRGTGIPVAVMPDGPLTIPYVR